MKKRIDYKTVKEFYSKVDNVWPSNNRWHNYNQSEIKKYIHKKLNNVLHSSKKVLNAGSGGTNYDLGIEMYHVDIVENKIKKYKHHFVTSIENIPFKDNFFDIVICVGSVINYCDAAKTVNELIRVLKHNGIIILEYENSYSFEYMNTISYKSSAAIITTSYFNKPHNMWVYSNKYICKLLLSNKIIIMDRHPYHILSSLIVHYTKDERLASRFSFLDVIFRHIPFIRNHSGNTILLGRKN